MRLKSTNPIFLNSPRGDKTQTTMPIYFSSHSTHGSDNTTLKMWPTYGHARSDIHLCGEKFLNKGLKQVEKIVQEDNLVRLSFLSHDKKKKFVMSVHRVEEALYDDRHKKYMCPEWVTYNSYTHRLESLNQYVDARVHLADYAMVTKEYNEYNWLSDAWHKTFDKAFDDMESVHDEDAPSFSIELEKGTATYWKVARHNMFGTYVRRDLLQSYKHREDLGDYIQHELI